MEFSRLEIREILAHVDAQSIDPDVYQKLCEGANQNVTRDSYQVVGKVIGRTSSNKPAASDDGIPPYVPITYTQEQLNKINKSLPEGQLPVTQETIAEINRQKEAAHRAEWSFRKRYVPNLNPNDAVNAAFAPPDLPAGYNTFENVAIGEQNSAGDLCVHIDNTDGASVFRCDSGHGYKQSKSLRSCPTCFTMGTGTVPREDRGAISGVDSNW